MSNKKVLEISVVAVALSSALALGSNYLLVNQLKKVEEIQEAYTTIVNEVRNIESSTVSVSDYNTLKEEVDSLSGKDLTVNNEDKENYSNNSTQSYVKSTDSVKLRVAAGTSSNILEVIDEGEKIKLVSSESEEKNGYTWIKVEYNGHVGWISSSFVKKVEVNQ